MPKRFSERTTVQKPILKYLSKIGWTIVSPNEALTLRNGETGLFFNDILKKQLKKLNPKTLNDSNVDSFIKGLENVKKTLEGAFEFTQYLRGQKTKHSEKENREFNISLIDFDTPSNNVFQVTEELSYTNGTYTNRADTVLYINGIPVIVLENKSATKENGIGEGLKQIRRYHKETPELVTFAQIFSVAEAINLVYGATWSLQKKNIYKWKDTETNSFEKKINTFFDRKNVLEFLKDYVVFSFKDDSLTKMILRQHQTRAVRKVLDRAEDDKKTSGLVWHTQGSGKTLTMIVAAQKLMETPAFDKPTVLMLIDRNELQDQLVKNLEACGLEVEKAMRKTHLEELLKSDYRGIIVSMIHKFENVPADLNKRHNIFVLVDEAHRTTSGDLGNFLMAALPNATYFGFTGTPIDKISYGKGTFKIFGKDDKQGYLDKYSIAESIEDGTTIPLNYSLAPNELRVPEQLLEEEFLNLAEAEGISDIDELNKILQKAVNLRNFLKSYDRIDKIAKYVADHYKSNVEPMGYKAFMVAVDREACAHYKKALDKYLPGEWSKVVYTSAHNDSEELKEFHLSEDDEKIIRKDFPKKETLPKILIVTEKLLTGFDAPILYAMYLDKPMRDHTLLQAIARVNRPYEESEDKRKPYGFVLDFVGIFNNLEKALAFDSDVVASVIHDLDLLKQQFKKLLSKEGQRYLNLIKGTFDDKDVEKIIEEFSNKKKRDDFKSFYKQVQTLYEIISPDKFLREFIDPYAVLSQMYAVVSNRFSETIDIDSDFLNKTAELVKKRVRNTDITEQLPIYEINHHTLEQLKKGKSSDKVKVINLIKSIKVYVENNKEKKKYLISVAEKAGKVQQAFEGQQSTTRECLKTLEDLINEVNEANKEQVDKKFDDETFFVYSLLCEFKIKTPEEAASEIKKFFNKYPNWKVNSSQKRDLRAAIYKLLLPDNNIDTATDFTERLFELLEYEK